MEKPSGAGEQASRPCKMAGDSQQVSNNLEEHTVGEEQQFLRFWRPSVCPESISQAPKERQKPARAAGAIHPPQSPSREETKLTEETVTETSLWNAPRKVLNGMADPASALCKVSRDPSAHPEEVDLEKQLPLNAVYEIPEAPSSPKEEVTQTVGAGGIVDQRAIPQSVHAKRSTRLPETVVEGQDSTESKDLIADCREALSASHDNREDYLQHRPEAEYEATGSIGAGSSPDRQILWRVQSAKEDKLNIPAPDETSGQKQAESPADESLALTLQDKEEEKSVPVAADETTEAVGAGSEIERRAIVRFSNVERAQQLLEDAETPTGSLERWGSQGKREAPTPAFQATAVKCMERDYASDSQPFHTTTEIDKDTPVDAVDSELQSSDGIPSASVKPALRDMHHVRDPCPHPEARNLENMQSVELPSKALKTESQYLAKESGAADQQRVVPEMHVERTQWQREEEQNCTEALGAGSVLGRGALWKPINTVRPSPQSEAHKETSESGAAAILPKEQRRRLCNVCRLQPSQSPKAEGEADAEAEAEEEEEVTGAQGAGSSPKMGSYQRTANFIRENKQPIDEDGVTRDVREEDLNRKFPVSISRAQSHLSPYFYPEIEVRAHDEAVAGPDPDPDPDLYLTSKPDADADADADANVRASANTREKGMPEVRPEANVEKELTESQEVRIGAARRERRGRAPMESSKQPGPTSDSSCQRSGAGQVQMKFEVTTASHELPMRMFGYISNEHKFEEEAPSAAVSQPDSYERSLHILDPANNKQQKDHESDVKTSTQAKLEREAVQQVHVPTLEEPSPIRLNGQETMPAEASSSDWREETVDKDEKPTLVLPRGSNFTASIRDDAEELPSKLTRERLRQQRRPGFKNRDTNRRRAQQQIAAEGSNGYRKEMGEPSTKSGLSAMGEQEPGNVPVPEDEYQRPRIRTRAKKEEREARSPKQGACNPKFEANVGYMELKGLVDPSAPVVGKLPQCQQCHAYLNYTSQVVNGLWKCEFCAHSNPADGVQPPAFPTTLQYLGSGDETKGEEEISFVLCVDTSGSMNKNILVKTQRREQEYLMRDGRLVSVWNVLRETLGELLKKLAKEKPNAGVGLVLFSAEVTVVGHNQTRLFGAQHGIQGPGSPSLLEDVQALSSSVHKVCGDFLKQPISTSLNTLERALADAEITGATALGPALSAALGLLEGKRRGSQLLVFTDGKANAGCGNLESPEGAQFYKELAHTVAKKGFIVSIYSVEGEDCGLVSLLPLVQRTHGIVRKCEVQHIQKEIELNYSESIATGVEMTLVAPKSLRFQDSSKEKQSAQLSECFEDVWANDVFLFEFTATDTLPSEAAQFIPMQAQITYTCNGKKLRRVATAQLKLALEPAALRVSNYAVVRKYAARVALGISARHRKVQNLQTLVEALQETPDAQLPPELQTERSACLEHIRGLIGELQRGLGDDIAVTVNQLTSVSAPAKPHIKQP